MSPEHEPPHEGQAEYQADREEDARIRKEEALAVAALVHEKEQAHRRIAMWQFLAYLLIVGISLLGWYKIETEADQRCQAGFVNRQALIDNVYSIETLGRNLVLGSTDPNAPTPTQQAALAQFAEFRKEQLKKLSAPICGGQVDLSPPDQR